MPDHHLPREEVTVPLCTEIKIEVVPVTKGSVGGVPLSGFHIVASREISNGPYSDTRKVVVKSFLNPNHSDTTKRHDANGHAVALSEIFGVMNVKLS